MPWMLRTLGALGILVLGLTAIGPTSEAGATGPTATNLVGTFGISPGQCSVSGLPSGSYMEIEIAGVPVPNVGSSCNQDAGAYTPLMPGSTGLVTGAYQPDPVPTFDATGNSEASAIIHPVHFLANTLGLATTCADQTSAPTRTGACATGATGFPVPSLEAVEPGQPGCPATSRADCLFGNLSGLGVTWAGLPVKSLLSDPLEALISLLSKAGSTCADTLGCASAGVDANPSTGATCVSATEPASCALFGTFNPATGAYTLGVSTGLDIDLLPEAVLQLVLRGTFTPSSNGSTTDSLGGLPDILPIGRSAGATASEGTSSTGGAPSAGAPSGSGSSTSSADASETSSGIEQLSGTFTLAPATCSGSVPTGSYFTLAYATLDEGNPSSPCGGGTYTLLQPGKTGLGIGTFSPNPSPTFDGNDNSLANSIITPVLYKGHALGLATSPDDVQDAPQGPAVFSPPEATVEGDNLAVDLRSLNVSYDGTPNDTCAQAFGVGCWQEGSQVATGTLNPATGDFTLDWHSSQDFTGGSGEVDFHLVGHFTGTMGPATASLDQPVSGSGYTVTSTAVETESFDSGSTHTRATAVHGSSTPIGSAAPTTSAPQTNVPLPPHFKAAAHRRQEALQSRAGGRPQTSEFPLLILVVGVVVAIALLLLGRRSRRGVDQIGEEQI
jgi:hypothetical protein